uniref:Uncharacterized protein n=1 Tax=Hyaloperonospora arabidopsidis (strain Emoy2) TaxID=559515 RepID=M4BSS7_HYAAE
MTSHTIITKRSRRKISSWVQLTTRMSTWPRQRRKCKRLCLIRYATFTPRRGNLRSV